LQLAKAADKVSDAGQLSSNLNDVKAVTDVEKAEDDPGADAIRGALSIRRFSSMRRSVRSTDIDPSGAIPIQLSNRRNRRDTRASEFTLGPTIREVPSEEEPRSSVEFNPDAPVTHIYPIRKPETIKVLSQNVEELDLSSKRDHNPLSPAFAADFRSAPPTPRYPIAKRSNLHKQFSFGSRGNRLPTEEETMGLVEQDQRGSRIEGDDQEPESPVSEPSESSDSERGHGERDKVRVYDMF
jgi:hypothetical protein